MKRENQHQTAAVKRAVSVICSCRTPGQFQVAFAYARLAARGLPLAVTARLDRLARRRLAAVNRTTARIQRMAVPPAE